MILRRYAQIVLFKAYADLRAERERTYLGLLWWVFEPILFMLVFYLVFGLVRGQRGPEFVAFLLVGVVSWQWFRASVAHCGNSIIGSLHLMRQVRIPPVILPLVVIVSDSVKFTIVLLLLLSVLWSLGHGPGLHYLALPAVLCVQLVLTMALGMIYGSLVPFLPDFRYVVEAVLHALMFLSGIFFAIEDVREPYRGWLLLNPIAGLLQDLRAVLLGSSMPDWPRLSLIALVALVLLGLAGWLVSVLAPRYTKLPG